MPSNGKNTSSKATGGAEKRTGMPKRTSKGAGSSGGVKTGTAKPGNKK